MCAFPADNDMWAVIISPLEQGIEKRRLSFFPSSIINFDGLSHAVKVAQVSFCCARLHDTACVVHLSLPDLGTSEYQFFEQLYVRSSQQWKQVEIAAPFGSIIAQRGLPCF